MNVVLLPVSQALYTANIVLYCLLLMFAVIARDDPRRQMAAIVGAIVTGLAFWQLTMLSVVTMDPESFIDMLTAQAPFVASQTPIGDVYPLTRLSVLIPTIPGFMAITRHLQKEKSSHG